MLRKIRIVLAALFFCGVTLLFLGIGRDWWGWMPRLQFLPATLRLVGGATVGNIAVVLGILLVTLLLGRIYCSVICPLGVFQDVIIWLRRTLGKAFPKCKGLRKRFRFNKERRLVRYPVLALVIAAVIFDLQIVVALLGPYSAYGRMVISLVGGGPVPLLIAAGVTFLLIAICAWLWGRAYCNTVCPVGTLLGCVSRYQAVGIRFDASKCVKCGACSRACKASCIEEGTLKIDRSRCIDCFDCIDSCSQHGISFGLLGAAPQELPGEDSGGTACGIVPENPQDASKRQFIATTALLIGTGIAASAQNMKVDGGLADVEAKTAIDREPRLVPPGAGSVQNFYDKCTACQLCVSACPNGVLRPSTDLEHFLQPQMGYEKGFCRPECTACSDICPSGAIKPLAGELKTNVRIGTATVNPDLCLAANGEHCGACVRKCPTGAIMMVAGENGHHRPAVAEEQCIGCGKCEYLCPVRPVSAITVKGLQTHINK